ncbi:MAG: nuclear transport factor 2 family protein [Erythrobacter cryptus]
MTSPRELLARVYATAATRDWAAVEALIHPDFVLYEAASLPFGGEWRGKDALQRCAAAMYGTWADTRLEILDCTGGESHAVMVIRLTMHPRDGSAPFTQTICELGTFTDGLLKTLHIHYFDAAEVAARAG